MEAYLNNPRCRKNPSLVIVWALSLVAAVLLVRGHQMKDKSVFFSLPRAVIIESILAPPMFPREIQLSQAVTRELLRAKGFTSLQYMFLSQRRTPALAPNDSTSLLSFICISWPYCSSPVYDLLSDSLPTSASLQAVKLLWETV